MVQNCLKPTVISFHQSTGFRTHGQCYSVGHQMVKVTNLMEIGNRNTDNIKIAVECQFMQVKISDMSTLLKYAKNAVIGEICGNRIFA